MANPINKYLVAVSGGVDSVVLLDMLSKKDDKILVAHFDHGIRDTSKDDAGFVHSLTQKYGVDFFSRREELGPGTSEEAARNRRYIFLREIAKQENAKLVTAHHLDDVIETIAINLMRGTGWRGLAVLNAGDVERPLLNYQKRDILDYAKKHNLEWREDSTNLSNAYTRNIVRHKLELTDDAKLQLQVLYNNQIRLSKEIAKEVNSLSKNIKNQHGEYSRYFINNIDNASAHEIVRYITKGKLTPPQIDSVINAIKTQRKGAVMEASRNIKLCFDTRFFRVKMIK